MFNPQKKYLYYPYGDTLKSAMVGNYDSDLNAFGEMNSPEMPYSQMGYRVYSEDFGRFLSPDPLFEQFDSWTPYHFAFNNPVMYSDPSGLAPKKEKREAKLLEAPNVYYNDSYEIYRNAMLNEMMALQREESRRRQDQLETEYFADWEEFDRWQAVTRNKMKGSSGDKYDNTYDLALATENKKNLEAKEKENKEKGNVEEEAIDNGYTTEEANINDKKVKDNYTWDKVTNERIKELDPRIQEDVYYFINRVEAIEGIQLRITDAYRSIDEQNELFSSGRGVTKASGGKSYHNYGLAFDVVIMEGGNAIWTTSISNEIANYGIELGFEWGGNWKSFKDYPHFQRTYGKSTRQLYQEWRNK